MAGHAGLPESSKWVETLRKFSLFSDLESNKDAMEHLASLMDEETFKIGSPIIEEGAKGDCVYFLTKGNVRVLKKTHEGENYIVAVLKDEMHPFFGEGVLLDEDSRGATVEALTSCHCLTLTAKAFDKFSSQQPQWALPILRRVARGVMIRLRKLNEDFVILYGALVAEMRGK